MESFKYRFFRQVTMSVMITSLSMCSTTAIYAANEVPVLLNEEKKKKVNNNKVTDDTSITLEDPPFEAKNPPVKLKDNTIDGMTMLYIGGAIGVAAIGVMVLGGGSGSGGSPALPDSGGPPSEPEETPYEGPDLKGSWAGFLDIQNESATGYQNVRADIAQRGSSVEIITSSTLAYGQYFTGTINNDGSMLMYDSITGQDWTTFQDNATEFRVDLYDFVNDFKDQDNLLLAR